MFTERKKARLRLLMVVAMAIGTSSTVLSATLAAFAAQDPQIESQANFA